MLLPGSVSQKIGHAKRQIDLAANQDLKKERKKRKRNKEEEEEEAEGRTTPEDWWTELCISRAEGADRQRAPTNVKPNPDSKDALRKHTKLHWTPIFSETLETNSEVPFPNWSWWLGRHASHSKSPGWCSLRRSRECHRIRNRTPLNPGCPDPTIQTPSMENDRSRGRYL